MYKVDKEGEITISGWEKGVASSPHKGIGDLKNVNISTEEGEASVNYSRVRQDQVPVVAATMTNSGSSTTFSYSGVLNAGTWIKVNSHTGSPGTTDNNYYYVAPIISGTSYTLWSDFGVTQITSGAGASTINFTTLTMGAPIDYTIEQFGTAGNKYRYYILDKNGVIWISGTSAAPSGSAGGLSSSTIWSAITPHGTVATDITAFDNNEGSINIQYVTDANNKISADYLIVFSASQILYGKNSDNSGWPSITGAAFNAWKTLNYSGGFSHHSILGNDQVIYFCDGPGVGVIYQKAGQTFDPANSATYSYVNAQYMMAPNDAATRITQIPSGNSISVIVGGVQNNLYVYPDVQASSSSKPINVVWMPEANVQYFVQANNYIIIFCGNKGNIYLTNGSSVVPIGTVPDYIAGSVTYVQDPYFVWGGAMYLRGRIFFSVKDQTATHTGNCGGVWSFVPTFNYFPQQDVGLAMRLENVSSQSATHGYNGYATILFAGQETAAQQANGPQYVAGWNQVTGATTTNSIDFSNTTPYTGGQALIESDAIPVGTFLRKKTFQQMEYHLSTPLVAGESIALNYRTDLTSAFASAGTVVTEATPASGNGSVVSGAITGLDFQKAQLVQFQIVLTSTVSSPSYCRLREVYIR